MPFYLHTNWVSFPSHSYSKFQRLENGENHSRFKTLQNWTKYRRWKDERCLISVGIWFESIPFEIRPNWNQGSRCNRMTPTHCWNLVRFIAGILIISLNTWQCLHFLLQWHPSNFLKWLLLRISMAYVEQEQNNRLIQYQMMY